MAHGTWRSQGGVANKRRVSRASVRGQTCLTAAEKEVETRANPGIASEEETADA